MISNGRLREALGLDDDFDESLLTALRERAQAFVETQTHHYFGEPETAVEIVKGNGTRHLRLSGAVIGPVTGVSGQEYPGATTEAFVVDTGYQLRDVGAVSYLVRVGADPWTAGYEYLVSYSRGYEVDSGPRDIEALIVGLVGHRIRTIGREGLRSETIGGYSWTRFGDTDLDGVDGANDTIASWRPVVLA